MKLYKICDYVSERVAASTLSEYNYISTENMLPNKGGITKSSNIPSGNVIAYSNEDVLISNIRPYFKKIWQANIDGGCSADVLCVRAKETIYPRYLYYLLSQDSFFEYVMAGSKGCKMPRGDKQQIMQWDVKIPEIGEQIRIAEFLSSIDSKIELNRRINENLEQQAQALFKSWFVDFEPFKDGKFVDSELGMIPEELTISRIGDIPHTIESGRRPKGGAVLKGIPSIGAENIKGLGYYDYSKTKYIPEDFALTTNRGKVYGYELLIYKDGGKPGYFIPNYTIFGEGFPFDEMYINEHVFRLDFMSKEYNVFAYFYMQTPYIMNQLNSIGGKAAIPGINTKDVESLPIFNGDNKKIQEFGNLVLPMITTILRNCRENARLAQLRDTLLPRLMSGKLKFSETTI